jgi:hypothetical protein
MTPTETRDLTILAIDRTRKVTLQVLQLFDGSDLGRATLLCNVAADLLRGAAIMVESDEYDEDEALVVVVGQLLQGLGFEKIQAMAARMAKG